MKKLKKKVKKFTKEVLSTDKEAIGAKWNPKVKRKLKAYAIESKHPIGEGKYHEYLLQITEWVNGEGFDIALSSNYNKNKMFSIHLDEIDLILKGLDKMKYFDYDKDEV